MWNKVLWTNEWKMKKTRKIKGRCNMRYVWHRPNNVSGKWSHTNCDALWIECYVLVLLHCLRLCSLQSLIQLWIMHNFQVLWDNERPSVQELKLNRKWTYQCCNNPKNTNLPLEGKKWLDPHWSVLGGFVDARKSRQGNANILQLRSMSGAQLCKVPARSYLCWRKNSSFWAQNALSLST